jgi:hypothetical protein
MQVSCVDLGDLGDIGVLGALWEPKAVTLESDQHRSQKRKGLWRPLDTHV